MTLNPQEMAHKKFVEAVQDIKNRDEQANTVIWTAVTINAGMGLAPLGINIWTFIGVSTAMVTFLGGSYGHHLTNKGAANIIKHIFLSVGTMYFALGLGLKFFAEVLKGIGVITMGGTTPAGMALDAVLCGAVTYAVGFTTKEYFKKNKGMSRNEIKNFFKISFEEGKTKIKNQKTK